MRPVGGQRANASEFPINGMPTIVEVSGATKNAAEQRRSLKRRITLTIHINSLLLVSSDWGVHALGCLQTTFQFTTTDKSSGCTLRARECRAWAGTFFQSLERNSRLHLGVSSFRREFRATFEATLEASSSDAQFFTVTAGSLGVSYSHDLNCNGTYGTQTRSELTASMAGRFPQPGNNNGRI